MHDAHRTCATLLVDLDVHLRVIMRVVFYADVAVTMEVYANACAKVDTRSPSQAGESRDERPAAVLAKTEALTKFGAEF